MCGIVGYIGKKNATPILIKGLKQLEYRGYDSAGIAVVSDGKIISFKSVGKVEKLEEKIKNRKIPGMAGIAHTRWATHGKPSDQNSHPHADCQGNIYLAHNGIVENHQELKRMLIKKNHRFTSETDSEVVAHLIEELNKKLNFVDSVAGALKMLRGTYGLVIINKKEPEKIIAARLGSPLILGIGCEECIIASDISAIIQHTKKVIYLEDQELAIITPEGYEILGFNSRQVNKKISELDWSVEEAQKGGFPHFMLKEIFEQPKTISEAIRGRLIASEGTANLGGLKDVSDKLKKLEKIIIVSCGTSYYAGLVGKYMLELCSGIPVEVEYASEFRYAQPIIGRKTAVLAISQSGETADTLAAIREAKNKKALTLGIVNVVGSTIARETDAGVYTHAGPEIGVASTKAFTSQLSILAIMALLLGRSRGMSQSKGRKILRELEKIPDLVAGILKKSAEIRTIAKKYRRYENFLYLGRKFNMPIAYEGALKIKEISYVHAEGYPTGEMKHGPIALIDEKFPSIFIIPRDSVYEKNLSGMEEIRSRGGKIIAIATVGDKTVKKIADDVIYVPNTLEMLMPLLTVIPLQLFAYHFGVFKGYDVDKPRNLAKSVTVE